MGTFTIQDGIESSSDELTWLRDVAALYPDAYRD